ncbi:unnamed protein product [Clavelina lepadiformis]|uniref:Yippee domain-containing protein n=1 Tax=Clavelina lepadiformis TaxID=159417 RepID=A0ABP0F607_CLALP
MTNMDDDDANGEETRVTLTKHNPTSVSSSFGESGRALSDPSPRQSVKTDVVYCAGCQRPIYDKYYMWVDKRSWHENYRTTTFVMFLSKKENQENPTNLLADKRPPVKVMIKFDDAIST